MSTNNIAALQYHLEFKHADITCKDDLNEVLVGIENNDPEAVTYSGLCGVTDDGIGRIPCVFAISLPAVLQGFAMAFPDAEIKVELVKSSALGPMQPLRMSQLNIN